MFRCRRLLRLAPLPLLVAVLAASPVASAQQPTTVDVLVDAVKEPKVALALGIQFVLGMALGYVSAKVLKYIVAFVGLLILGMLLNVWTIGEASSTEEALLSITERLQEIWPLLKSFLATLGILTVGPTSVGFLVGALIAFMRK